MLAIAGSANGEVDCEVQVLETLMLLQRLPKLPAAFDSRLPSFTASLWRSSYSWSSRQRRGYYWSAAPPPA